MVRPQKLPCKNEDGAPCKECGATENTLWYCAYDADQKRHWLCAGNRLQRGKVVRCNDRAHKDRRDSTGNRNIEDAGWTPWKPAPELAPQKRASPKKKAAKHHAQASKRKTQVPPRSAEPKKPKQPKKLTLWDDEAEDEDEDGEDDEGEDEPDSEDARFIDDESEQSNDDASAHRALDAELARADGDAPHMLATPKDATQAAASPYALPEDESEEDSPQMRPGPARQRRGVLRSGGTEVLTPVPGATPADDPKEGGAEGPEEEQGDLLERRNWWPPLRRNKKQTQDLPPALAFSPEGVGEGGNPAPVRMYDFSITYTPEPPARTDENPHPKAPSDAACVRAVRYFQMQTFKLYSKMYNADKSTESEKDVLKLYDATGSAERGDMLGKPHAQQFIRVKTRRTLENAKKIIALVLKFNCILEDPRLGVHLEVKPRGTQSAEYAHGYAYKDQAEGDLFNAETPLPEEAGHFRIGLSIAYAQECDMGYKSYANDQNNKIAYSKGGANRPVRWTGKSKKFPITKTSALDLGHAFVETEKFGEFGRRLPAIQKIALLLQGGHHFLAPSFCMAYGNSRIDEEQVAALELVNNNVMRAEDVALVRKACFNYYERPSTLSDSLVMYKPGVLLSNQAAEELNLFEMRRHRDSHVLPPRVELARRFPHVPMGAKGQMIAIDFDYMFPYGLGESSASILEYFAEAHQFNIHPHIYHVGGIDNGQQSAYVSLGEIFLMYTKYSMRSFADVTKFHVQSYLDYDWRRWCDRAGQLQGHAGAGVSTEHMEKLLDALKGADDFTIDLHSFHGIMSARDFLSKFKSWKPQRGDEAAERRTHTVIIVAYPQAIPPPPPRAHPELVPDVPGVVQLDLTDLENVLREQRLQTPGGEALRILDECQAQAEADDTRDDAVPGTDAAGVPIPHYYMLAWRYGQHAIVHRRLGRENLTPFGERPRHVSIGMEPEQARIAAAALRRGIAMEYDDDGPNEFGEEDAEEGL